VQVSNFTQLTFCNMLCDISKDIDLNQNCFVRYTSLRQKRRNPNQTFNYILLNHAFDVANTEVDEN